MNGYLTLLLVMGLQVLLALSPPRRPGWLATATFLLSSAYNEAPFLFIYLLMAVGLAPLIGGELNSPLGAVSGGLTVLVLAGFTLIIIRAAKARGVVQESLNRALGVDWRDDLRPEVAKTLRTVPPLINILFVPFVIRPHDVERLANINYGPAGRENTLDLFRSTRRPSNAPLLVYFHGGRYHSGSKIVDAAGQLAASSPPWWV